MIEIATWGIPQWIIAIVLTFNVLTMYILHGRPRGDWDGGMIFFNALFNFSLLTWGGFFS